MSDAAHNPPGKLANYNLFSSHSAPMAALTRAGAAADAALSERAFTAPLAA